MVKSFHVLPARIGEDSLSTVFWNTSDGGASILLVLREPYLMSRASSAEYLTRFIRLYFHNTWPGHVVMDTWGSCAIEHISRKVGALIRVNLRKIMMLDALCMQRRMVLIPKMQIHKSQEDGQMQD